MHLNPASSFRFANNLENKFRTVSLYMNRFHFRFDVCLVLRLYKSKKICTEKSRHVLLHLSMHIHVCLFSLTSKNILTLPLIFTYIPLFTYMQIPLFTKMSYSLSLSHTLYPSLSISISLPSTLWHTVTNNWRSWCKNKASTPVTKIVLVEFHIFLYIVDRSVQRSDKLNAFIRIFAPMHCDLWEEESAMSRTRLGFCSKI